MTSSDTRDDAIIDDFMREYGTAPDKEAVVARFCADHPRLAGAFREFTAMAARLDAAGPDPEPPRRLRPGDALGDFRVVRFVAEGGMGEIYEAEQVRLSRRKVALKVIRHGHVSPAARERFLREQEVLAKLHQTNIVPVFAAGERDGLQFFAMQYVDGATLGHVVRFLRARSTGSTSAQTPSLAKLVESVAGPAAPPGPDAPTGEPADPSATDSSPRAHVLTTEYLRSVAGSLADVAEALDAAHAAGVLHRDVKPSNLMAERSGKCWVIDFGLAGLVTEAMPGPGAPDMPTDPALTATGGVMGTPAYMGPEQFAGRPDRQSDVWSLGVTLYELLALERPFPGPTREDYQWQVTAADPPPIRDVPPDLEAICRKALRRDPAERYQTAGEFAADLRRWLRHEPTKANPPWAWRRMAMWARREPGWAGMIGVVCAAMIGVVGLLLDRQHQKTVTAQERAEAVERERQATVAAAEREVRLRDRQLAMFRFEQEYHPPHTAGWRARLWGKGQQLLSQGAEPELRDRMVTVLEGLDVLPIRGFTDGPAPALAFDPAGRRLLMRGWQDPSDPTKNQPTRVRDLTTGRVTSSRQTGIAAVSWRGGVPVQLVRPVTGSTFELWNVDEDSVIEGFEFPDRLRPIPDFARMLHRAAHHLCGVPWFRIPGPMVRAVAMSGDSTRVAALVRSAGGGRTVIIWRTGNRTGPETIPVSASEDPEAPDEIALGPDGSLLALGTGTGRVSVWTLTGAPDEIGTFDLGRGPVTALAFARHRAATDPDRCHPKGVTGWLLAAGNAGGRVAVWDLGTHERGMTACQSHYEVLGLGFSPDGTTGFSTGRVECRVWDVTTGRQLLVISPGRNVIPAVAVSPAGDRLALGSIPRFGSEAGVDLFDLESGRGVQALRGLTGHVARVTITSDGRYVAALTQDRLVGAWDTASGEMLMRADAPSAMYADHCDIRLTDDGRFLVVAGGKLAQRWEVPRPPSGGLPRKVNAWDLNPAFSNRLAITPDGIIRLCRNETKSGKKYPTNQVHPAADPRCVRIYELQPDGRTEETAEHQDHAWCVYLIHAVPDGSCFIADGIGKRGKESNTIVAYPGRGHTPLWRVSIPDAPGEGSSAIDSTGRILHYWQDRETVWARGLPFRGQPDVRTLAGMTPGAYPKIVMRRGASGGRGIQLAGSDSSRHFLKLSPDDPVSSLCPQFTADGRFVVWGTEDGTVRVADLARVREVLEPVGLGW